MEVPNLGAARRKARAAGFANPDRLPDVCEGSGTQWTLSGFLFFLGEGLSKATALSVMAKVPPVRAAVDVAQVQMRVEVPQVRMGVEVPRMGTGEIPTVAQPQAPSHEGIPDKAQSGPPSGRSYPESTDPRRNPTIPGLPVPRLRLAPTLLATPRVPSPPRVPSAALGDESRPPRMASRNPTDRHPWPRTQSPPPGADAQASGIPSPIRSAYPRTEAWRNQRIRRYFP